MRFAHISKPTEAKSRASPAWKKYAMIGTLALAGAGPLLMPGCTPNNAVKATPSGADTLAALQALYDGCKKCCPNNIQGCIIEKIQKSPKARNSAK